MKTLFNKCKHLFATRPWQIEHQGTCHLFTRRRGADTSIKMESICICACLIVVSFSRSRSVKALVTVSVCLSSCCPFCLWRSMVALVRSPAQVRVTVSVFGLLVNTDLLLLFLTRLDEMRSLCRQSITYSLARVPANRETGTCD